MHDEGYIKFHAHWTPTQPLPSAETEALHFWRQRCYEKGWIGVYPDGTGFGNISRRWDRTGRFLITGSATGQFPQLDPSHFALVEKVTPNTNELWCSGPIIASSESMSHGVIYENCPEVHGIIHIHNLGMWSKLLKSGLCTRTDATYGSPEMAEAILTLLRERELPQQKIFAMPGHREGVFAFGATLEEAFGILRKA